MSNKLPIPDDLQHLIEKRAGAERRGADAADRDATGDMVDIPNEGKAEERRQAIRRSEDRDA